MVDALTIGMIIVSKTKSLVMLTNLTFKRYF